MRDDVIRRQRISGSDIGAIAGLSPWRSPLAVYLDKIGEQREEISGHHIERGTHLGPALVEWYAQRTGHTVVDYGDNERTVVHPVHDLVCATPDGVVLGGGLSGGTVAALEVKSPGPRSYREWGEPGTDQIPDHYVPQVTFEAAVLGAPRTDVAALIDGDLAIYSVPYDAELFAALYEVGEKFMREHVIARIPPPVDGSDDAREWLARQHPRATRDLIEATAQAEELVNEYRAIAAREKELDERKRFVRNSLVQIIGDHAGIRGLATLSGGERRVTDWEALARRLGASEEQIAEATAVRAQSRSLRVR